MSMPAQESRQESSRQDSPPAPQPQDYASYQTPDYHTYVTDAEASAYAPEPLPNLQAGLDQLNGMLQVSPSPTMPSYAPAAQSQNSSHNLHELAAALSGDATDLGSTLAMAELAAVVAQGPPAAERRTSAPARVDQPVRVRAARPPPDLSKLPAGLAASLSRLAGGGTSTPGAAPAPVRRPVRTPT